MRSAPGLEANPLIRQAELERLHGEAFSWALTCAGGRRAEAEDVLQMTYVAILEGKARFRGDSSLRTWLFAVIANIARSGWRRARARLGLLARMMSAAPQEQVADFTSPREAGPEDRYRADQSRDRVIAAWRALPARQREVLDLVFYRDMTIEEAARVLGVSLGTARVHYERAKASLRAKVAE
jgi:RNA polymerase sigma-70 factor (ECF subfamily)